MIWTVLWLTWFWLNSDLNLALKDSSATVMSTSSLPSQSVPNFSWIRVSCELEPILWFVRKDEEEKEKNEEEKTETLVSCILETPGTIYFNFGIQPPLIGGHFHSKFSDLQVKGHGSMNVWKSLPFVVLLIYSLLFRASWAARRTTVCLDLYHSLFIYYTT